MIFKTLISTFIFCGFFTIASASQNSHLKEDIFDVNKAKQFFLTFVNTTKTEKDMTDAEKNFAKHYDIDVSRTIQFVAFADEARYLDTNVLYGKRVVMGPLYFPEGVSKNQLIGDLSSSIFDHDATYVYQNYCSVAFEINYEVKIPIPPRSQEAYNAPEEVYAPAPAIKRRTINVGSSFSIALVDNVTTTSKGHQFTISDKSYSAEEFEQKTGIKSFSFDIDTPNIVVRPIGEGCKIPELNMGSIKKGTPIYRLTTNSGTFTIFDNNSLNVKNYISRKRDISEKNCTNIQEFEKHLMNCGIKITKIQKLD